jgi:hypothetical protein
VSVIQETVLVAGREVRRNLKSAKGIVLLVLCVMGGVIAALLMAWVQKLDLAHAAAAQISDEQIKTLQEMALSRKYGDEAMGKYLAQAPMVLIAATLTGVWLAPMLVALVGVDSIPTDLQHRGIRYITVRANRVSYYVGKLVGLWLVVSLMMLLSHAFIWGVALVRGAATFSEIVGWGPRFGLVTVAVAAAWCGVAQLVASQFRVPILALLVTFVSFFGVWIVDAVGELSQKLHVLVYAYPNTYDAWLLSPHAERIALGALICVAFMAATSAVGAFAFTRRDL